MKTNGSGARKCTYLIAGYVDQERLREVLYYDVATGLFYWKNNNEVAGSIGTNYYLKIQIDNIRYGGHTLAWLYVHGEWAMVDHENRVRYDNRISNLRRTTHQLNAANRDRIWNNSGAKGVYYKRGKYEAGIKVNQKRIYLGIYDNVDDAAEAYRQAALYYFGEFANVD